MAEIGLFEAIRSARALRRFKAVPVPDEIITRVLEAAICAPTGGNLQDWLFVVITDADQRERIGAAYAKGSRLVRPYYSDAARPAHMSDGEYKRLQESGFHLHEHMAEAPVLILVAAKKRLARHYDNIDPAAAERSQLCTRMASIYPAVQNIILACRALGLGTVLTTNHLLCEEEVKKIAGLPDDFETFALMPVGYPLGKFGVIRRKPLSEVAVRDRWGNPWQS